MKPMRALTIEGWHSEAKAAELLGISLETLRRMRRLKSGPKWVRHGRRILYRDGSEHEYLLGLQARADAAGALRGRGRPRSA
jgi:hypothetical protein